MPSPVAFAVSLVMAAGLLAGAALAAGGHQQQQHGHGQRQAHSHGGSSPYAGMETRQIKALSADDIAGLEQGQGMRMALPAELNGYPGPRHVLDLAAELGLTAAQRHATEALFQAMAAEARGLGAELIAAEAGLDRIFAGKTATAEAVNKATADAASIRASLRAAHLRAHIAMMDVLNPHQIALYKDLRGYR